MSNPIPSQPKQAKTLEQIIWNCLRNAVVRFNKSVDRQTLLCPLHKDARPKTFGWPAANEEAIAHRLAFYLECEFRIAKIITDKSPVRVDCEYDRHLEGRKRLEAEKDYWKIVEEAGRTLKLQAGSDRIAEFAVFPDIVVHERQFDRKNLLVIEVKKRTTALVQKWQRDYDDLKLKVFTRPKPRRGYGYKIGAWVVAEDMCMPAKRHLRIVKRYTDGDGKALAP